MPTLTHQHASTVLHRQARREAVQKLMVALVADIATLRHADELLADRPVLYSCEDVGRRRLADVAVVVYPLLEALEALEALAIAGARACDDR
jgi:hypothetical protein